jgi:plasmid maintenance system killer protein
VDIDYSNNRLEAASLNLAKAVHLFGLPVGRKYIQRISILRAVGKFSELYGLRTLRLHQLKGNRSGEYSITLTGNYRLIIENMQEEKVLIVAVEDYHGN